MTRIYAATVVALFVTTSLATNVLVAGRRGPVAPGLSTKLRLVSRRLGRRAGRLIDVWVAAIIARRERQATSWAFYYMSDRELKDVGLYRDSLGRGEVLGGRQPLPGARAASFMAHPE